MKSVPSCNSLDIVHTRSNSFIDSRAYKVANLVAMIFGLLILAAGIACTIIFGVELGSLYTMVTLGVSIAVGSILLTIGASCLGFRSLFNKTHRIDRTAEDTKIVKLKQEIFKSTSQIEEEEKKLLKLSEEYKKVHLELKTLLKKKDQASKKLEEVNEKYTEARADLNSLLEKIQKDSSSSGGGGGGDLLGLKKALITSKKTLENAFSTYQKTLATVENINKDIHQKEQSLENLHLVSSYQHFQSLLKKQISSCSSLIDILEHRVCDLQTHLRTIQEEELKLKQRLQQIQSGGSDFSDSFDKAAIEKLKKEIDLLNREKKESQKELQERLEQLHKGKWDTDKLVDGARGRIDNQELCHIVMELEQQLHYTQLGIKDKEKCIQELEEELSNLQRLSKLERENLQDEIRKLMEFSEMDNHKMTDLIKQGQSLMVLMEQNSILRHRLEQLEKRRVQEEANYENGLLKIHRLHEEEQNRLAQDYQIQIDQMKLNHSHDLQQLQIRQEELRRRFEKADQEKNEQINKLKLEISKLQNTSILYNRMIDRYRGIFKEEAPSDILADFIEENENIREQELKKHFTRDEIRSLDVSAQLLLDDARQQITELEEQIVALRKELNEPKKSKKK
ncbi:hypothetical protein SBV43_00005 [Chlamydia crocodili]|uniref:hypothetical protein n=1 Tax=Chlamydia crocodili TaxID=2766982 RepID=UPI003D3EF721